MAILVGIFTCVVGLVLVVVAAPILLGVLAASFVVGFFAVSALGSGIWVALRGRPLSRK